MTKRTVVVFSQLNARIVKTTDITPYEGLDYVVIDPDMKDLVGTPPHFWKQIGQRIVPMNDSEKRLRIADMQKALSFEAPKPKPKPVETVHPAEVKKHVDSMLIWYYLIALALAAGVLVGMNL